jgi:hypothetical protein
VGVKFQHHGTAGGKQFSAASCIFYMADNTLAVYLHIGDKAIGTFQKTSLHCMFISHVNLIFPEKSGFCFGYHNKANFGFTQVFPAAVFFFYNSNFKKNSRSCPLTVAPLIKIC